MSNASELQCLAYEFAEGIRLADSRRPIAVNSRSKNPFQPGIGPHTETKAVDLAMKEMAAKLPGRYRPYSLGVPYPNLQLQRCDLCLGTSPC